MEEAAPVRRAASEATADVVPDPLRETIEAHVAASSLVPGVLTLLCARSVADDPADGYEEQAAGVQLIYTGLALTRRLIQAPPWGDPARASGAEPPAVDGGTESGGLEADGDGRPADGPAPAPIGDPDMAVLAADVLVSRGFYLLARTEAAEEAVAVVRDFGRDQTDRETTTGDAATALDSRLEADVLELAVTVGVNTAGGRTDDAAALAADLCPAAPGFGPADGFFDDARRGRVDALAVEPARPLNRND